MEEFLKIAYDRCNYSNEQALGLLFMFQYDMTKALSELQNYVPFEGTTYFIFYNWIVYIHISFFVYT